MKRKYLLIALVFIIIFIWWQPFNLAKTEVTVPDKVSAREIATFLSEQQIVRNVDEFLLWLKLLGREKQLKAGKYELPVYRNPIYVINRLTAGGRSEIIVTIREGLTSQETAELLAHHGLIDPVRFIELCEDQDFIRDLGLNAASLEGYLFPDTYSFSSLQGEEEIIRTVMDNFTRHVARFGVESSDSLHKIIILASIVEKEAKYHDERPIIARVFINRLLTGRPLESCATVFYSLKTSRPALKKKKLTDADLKTDSPYNSYLHIGLPPGPICSPGESSIEAVMVPADVNYLYFVAKGDGRHHFSRTYREHIAAKERYQ
ncbi:MAG: endolytic transglycosylase MltG [candidate division WOR-3 bacterium]|jgi:UPF0755 protein